MSRINCKCRYCYYVYVTGGSQVLDISRLTENVQTVKYIIMCTIFNSYNWKGYSLCLKSKGMQVHFKGTNTIRTQLVNPNDKDPKTQKSGIIYHYKCPHINCPEAYTGETGRAEGERVKEHLKAPSLILLHSTSRWHSLDSENFNITHKEVHSHARTIKEAMFICVNDPTLNRNLGKYQLLHVWDSILQALPMLQLKPSSLYSSTTPYQCITPTPVHTQAQCPQLLTPGGAMYFSW